MITNSNLNDILNIASIRGRLHHHLTIDRSLEYHHQEKLWIPIKYVVYFNLFLLTTEIGLMILMCLFSFDFCSGLGQAG